MRCHLPDLPDPCAIKIERSLLHFYSGMINLITEENGFPNQL